jgi:hypothetical protein
VGLATNGVDPLIVNPWIDANSVDRAGAGPAPTVDRTLAIGSPPPMPPGRGREHLLRLLETLARIQVDETFLFAQLLRNGMRGLPWGTTLILVTPRVDDDVFDELFRARRSGLNAFLVQCGPASNYHEVRRRADHFGFPLIQVLDEDDLDIWRM